MNKSVYALRGPEKLVICFGVLFLLVSTTMGFVTVGKQPPGFIPMFYDESDNEALLINASTISRMVPFEDHIDVTFVDGKTFTIYEDYQEFKDRIRTSFK